MIQTGCIFYLNNVFCYFGDSLIGVQIHNIIIKCPGWWTIILSAYHNSRRLLRCTVASKFVICFQIISQRTSVSLHAWHLWFIIGVILELLMRTLRFSSTSLSLIAMNNTINKFTCKPTSGSWTPDMHNLQISLIAHIAAISILSSRYKLLIPSNYAFTHTTSTNTVSKIIRIFTLLNIIVWYGIITSA